MALLDSDDMGLIALRASWATFSVALVTFALRVHCRLRYVPRLGGGLYSDDLMTLACLLVLLLFCVLLAVGRGAGVGRHYADLTPANQVAALRWEAVLGAVTPWLCTLPKFAVVMTLRRILDFGRRTTLLFWGLALSSQATVVVLTLWTFLQCAPVAYQWDRTVVGPDGTGWCASYRVTFVMTYIVFAYSTALDVFFALYPVPYVMRLKMPLRTRLAVSLSLSLGLVGFAVSIYKFSVLPAFTELVATDPTFPMIYISMTHAVEGACLIIASSLTTLRPLFRSVKARVNDMTGHGASSRRLSSRGGGFTGASSQVQCIISTRLSHDGTLSGGRDHDEHHQTVAPGGKYADMEGDIVVQKTIQVSISDAAARGTLAQ